MDFDQFLSTADAEHGDAPAAVAARLGDGVLLAQTAAHVAGLARLGTHVLGEHLGQWDQGLAWLARLRTLALTDDATRSALDRHAASLRWAAGEPDAEAALAALGRDERIAALAAAATMLAGRTDLDHAIASYQQALTEAEPGLADGSPALRALAVGGNNLAVTLEEQASLSPAQTEGMLRAAEGGLRYWQRAGSWMQAQRAHHRLGSSRLRAGQASAAADSARACLALCADHAAPAFEAFFGHALLARAERAAGRDEAAATAASAARAAYAQVDADERVWCDSELKDLP